MSDKNVKAKIQVRRDTAQNWGTKNPILADGEFGYDTTNKLIKIGNGTAAWNDIAKSVKCNEGELSPEYLQRVADEVFERLTGVIRNENLVYSDTAPSDPAGYPEGTFWIKNSQNAERLEIWMRSKTTHQMEVDNEIIGGYLPEMLAVGLIKVRDNAAPEPDDIIFPFSYSGRSQSNNSPEMNNILTRFRDIAHDLEIVSEIGETNNFYSQLCCVVAPREVTEVGLSLNTSLLGRDLSNKESYHVYSCQGYESTDIVAPWGIYRVVNAMEEEEIVPGWCFVHDNAAAFACTDQNGEFYHNSQTGVSIDMRIHGYPLFEPINLKKGSDIPALKDFLEVNGIADILVIDLNEFIDVSYAYAEALGDIFMEVLFPSTESSVIELKEALLSLPEYQHLTQSIVEDGNFYMFFAPYGNYEERQTSITETVTTPVWTKIK